MKNSEPTIGRSRSCPNHGFTLIELLVVITVIAILAAMLLPALTKAKIRAHGITCMSNSRQLCMAWRNYAEDNGEVLVYASYNGNRNDPNCLSAWTLTAMDFSADPYNWDPAIDIMVRPLWPYAKNAAIYRCPADHSTVKDSQGVIHPRIRTYSMNLYVGGFAPNYPPLGGPGHSLRAIDPHAVYTKMTDIAGSVPSPGPSKLWVFLDQREDTITWGNYYCDMAGYDPSDPASYQFYEDMPGSYHHLAAGLAFADGHAEIHRWKDPRTYPPPDIAPFYALLSPGNQDIAWLQERTTRKRN